MHEQDTLFCETSASLGERLDLPDADVTFLPHFFGPPDRNRFLAEIDETTVWSHETFKMYGKVMPIPRLSAWYGDAGRSYTYSGISMQPRKWTPPLEEMKDALEREVGAAFNSVLLNLYRDGRDSVAWHSDDEAELGPEPVIGSVSLGATRRFQLRHKATAGLRHEMELTHGSLLVMRGPTQRHWQHQVPKTSRSVGPRINLTFRRIG